MKFLTLSLEADNQNDLSCFCDLTVWRYSLRSGISNNMVPWPGQHTNNHLWSHHIIQNMHRLVLLVTLHHSSTGNEIFLLSTCCKSLWIFSVIRLICFCFFSSSVLHVCFWFLFPKLDVEERSADDIINLLKQSKRVSSTSMVMAFVFSATEMM